MKTLERIEAVKQMDLPEHMIELAMHQDAQGDSEKEAIWKEHFSFLNTQFKP